MYNWTETRTEIIPPKIQVCLEILEIYKDTMKDRPDENLKNAAIRLLKDYITK